jgi:hypothetical protein
VKTIGGQRKQITFRDLWGEIGKLGSRGQRVGDRGMSSKSIRANRKYRADVRVEYGIEIFRHAVRGRCQNRPGCH